MTREPVVYSRGLVLGVEGERLVLRSTFSSSISILPLSATITANGLKLRVSALEAELDADCSALVVRTTFEPLRLELRQQFSVKRDDMVQVASWITNSSDETVILNRVGLLAAGQDGKASISFSGRPEECITYEQDNYSVRLRRFVGGEGETSQHRSFNVWLSYDQTERAALCVGFLTGERWRGEIQTDARDGNPTSWAVGFDGGDLPLKFGEEVSLEEFILQAGSDPWSLLEGYADAVAARHGPRIPARSPISWCSWYPFRLGVTEEKILANACIASRRLKDLGLSIIEVDLGWERNQLPGTFEENDQFPHGLAWLSDRLSEMGFRLGAWKGPFTISEFDPVFKEHPDWLLGAAEADGPAPTGEWFWKPHGKTYALDLTHPGAQDWLRQKMHTLATRGVRYLKADFIGGAMTPALRRRHDPSIVAGGGTEASRIGLRIVREEMEAEDPDALLLNCSGPELPGTGCFPLIYVCNDTGNTGYLGWKFHARNYGLNLAGHLFKNRRFGVIQPSCLCVGLPGTLEEARLRATATFLSGGQVDISDDLTTLPEDRWQVLLSTLPPLGVSARPVDLFEPLAGKSWRYDALARGDEDSTDSPAELEGSRVWHLHVVGDWDEWDLVGLFSYENPGEDQAPAMASYSIPLRRLGLQQGKRYWVYDFWSGQFLGTLPSSTRQASRYVHPGDAQVPLIAGKQDSLDISFFGPGVRLLVIRVARDHPWPLGSSFHQSGGVELGDVVWDGSTLRGEVRRPAGIDGFVTLAGAGLRVCGALVDELNAPLRPSSNGSFVLPLTTQASATSFNVAFDPR